jgi:hypothetical protein
LLPRFVAFTGAGLLTVPHRLLLGVLGDGQDRVGSLEPGNRDLEAAVGELLGLDRVVARFAVWRAAVSLKPGTGMR